MSKLIKDLGAVSAYAYAVEKGYTGTEEEFAELMADYASVGQSAAQSAEQAAASATSASGSAATASEAAQTATDKASEAVTAAGTSTTKASEASTSADTASAAATSAGTSAQTATTAAATATEKASEASESAATATTAKTDAESARDAAAQSASEAAESARTLTTDATLTQSGQAADAKVVGDKINLIATFDSGRDEIVYHKSDLQTAYDSTYVNNGYISDTGRFSASNSYRTYYMQATEDMNVWLEDSTAYLSLAVYGVTISPRTFVARYHNNDSSLPTEANRLSIANGQWLAVTFGYSSHIDRDFNLYTGLYKTVSIDPIPTDEFMSAINEHIDIPSDKIGTVSKNATSLTVVIGRLKYEINKYSNSTIRAYMWRTNACRILDNNGMYQTVWQDSDSDGVVKISGEGDFIGGYHGDETETLFHLFIDGVEYAEDSEFTDMTFKEIILFSESDVYHCNTSENPDVIAFKRNKIIKFNGEGYTVENYWTAQENLTCEVAYIGMLSVENALINAYHTNHDFKYHALDDDTSRSADMTDVCFNTPYGNIGMEVSEPVPSEHYGCVVSVYTGRLKVYASNFNSSAHGILGVGDVIKGKATIYFNG